MFILKIAPPMRCFDPECERLTAIAEASFTGPHDRQIDVTPICWEHGYINAASPEVQYASIARFVVGYYDGGEASIAGPCPLDNVPGVDPECPLISEEALSTLEADHWHEGLTDEAWYVIYTNGSQVKRLAAVWCNVECKFLLYEFPAPPPS